MLRFLRQQLFDLLLGVAVTVGIFLVVEGVLRVGGFGSDEVRAPRHIAAGFDPDVQVFRPDPDQEGGWRTTYSHGQSKEITVRPKGDAIRVLLFGGSNTGGFPARVLKEALNEQGDESYEVINLGRAGYGSTRVAILFRDALRCLEPDLVVLYSGHNEFVEKSFAMDLEEAWANPVVARLAGLVESTTTGRFLTESMREDTATGSAYSRLDEWEAEYKKFREVPSEQTRAVWNAYEDNLRYMCALAGECDLPVLLCTPVWNRFSPPRVDAPHEGVEEADAREADKLRKRAQQKMPAALLALLPTKDKDRIHIFDFGRPNDARTDGSLEKPLLGLRPSLDWLEGQDTAFTADRVWEPKVHTWYAALDWLHAERPPEEVEALQAARSLLRRARDRSPDSCHLVYEHALVRYALGEREPGLFEDFQRAAELDRAPRKANPASNARVLAVAADFPNVTLFDADTRFMEGAADGLVGWEWMVDHCHLSPGGAAMLMKEIAAPLAGLRRSVQ